MFELKLQDETLAGLQVKINELASKKSETVSTEKPKKSVKGFSTLEDLLYQVANDYDQYLGCHADCLEIAAEIKNKTWSTGSESLDRAFIGYALKNDVANTLCNVNVRILLINNYRERNGMEPVEFKTAYKAILNGSGLKKNTITTIADRKDFYSNFNINIDSEVVQIETKDIFPHLQNGRLYAIRLISPGHTTMAFCRDRQLISLDTASSQRNNKDILSRIVSGNLYNREITWIEYIK